ncbi:hypothetical protein IscW_ISCW021100 [Ixodes scapularis]|uniref:Uncharacterized protein n=1 Tax=Ixodes scapularis TaxID=6945 RepID=B7Q3X1_IXOSC|nr:hypothetical protein IscW_ISCW021100 [Ixodes scapularis]|eukprot:XP_002399681.1 hypothetical protein IscW_ISCW021100 [Ixodes scapularis]
MDYFRALEGHELVLKDHYRIYSSNSHNVYEENLKVRFSTEHARWPIAPFDSMIPSVYRTETPSSYKDTICEDWISIENSVLDLVIRYVIYAHRNDWLYMCFVVKQTQGPCA